MHAHTLKKVMTNRNRFTSIDSSISIQEEDEKSVFLTIPPGGESQINI